VIFPTDEEIKSKHPEGNTFVFTAAIPFDHETAVTLADRFANEEHFILLESAANGPNARYSIIGYDLDFSQRRKHVVCRDSGQKKKIPKR
jgi:hypothetical protein